jgi:TPR repeat protein
MRTKQLLTSNLRLLGQCLLLGFLLTPIMAVGQGTDFEEMFESASQGNAGAQFNIGLMYRNGDGVPQDYAEAMKWHRLAADQGDANAQNSLGAMYDSGEGVPEDAAEAVKWYRLAADQGHATAQNNLGGMYGNGEGVPRNYVTAYAWWNIAAVFGHEGAIANRSAVEQAMTPAQIDESQQLSTEIFERIQQGN